MISTDAAPHSPEGTANPAPFLFSIPGAEPINLYPILLSGANLNIIGEHLPGPLYAKDNRGVRTPTPLYYRLYRFLKRLEKAGLLTSEKGVQDLGLGDRPCLWYRPTLAGVMGVYKPLNLIERAQNSNSPQITPLKPEERPDYEGPKWMRIPKRTNPKRVGAALRLMRIKTRADHWLYVRQDTGRRNKDGHPIKVLQPELVEKLREPEELYHQYLTEIDGKQIMLVPRGEGSRPDPSRVKMIPYRTRFNDPGRRRRHLDRYDYAWAEAETEYQKGIYVTLTTDPAMHANLWAANRHCSPAWNRYLAYLAKKHGFRPKYIKVVEYQENGLIHLHCVFFGINRIDNISDDWQRSGQGRITKAIPVKLDDAGLWQWSGTRPEDAKQGESVTDYLKKYLKKSVFNPQDLFLYWAINTRFFSCSRVFSPPPAPQSSAPPQWDYVGVTPDGGIPDWLRYLSERRIPDPIEITAAPDTWWRDSPYMIGRRPAFVPASTLPRSGPPPGSPPPLAASGGAERLPGLSLADFM